jgi:PPOX class probable F420-dependent enzyme
VLSEEQLAFALAQRVAHLGTADASGEPHVVAVCFAWHDGAFWTAIDEKPKRGTGLKRLRNIAANPRVSLLFDRWDEDWSRLGWVLVHGRAEVVEGRAHPEALAALRARYRQYRAMALEERPLVRVVAERVSEWGAIG